MKEFKLKKGAEVDVSVHPQTGAVTIRTGVRYFEDGKVTRRFEKLADAIAERYADSFRELSKGLELLHADENPRGVPPGMVDKLRKLLFAPETANDLDQVSRFPGWRLHALKGDLKGHWSLTVTGNWRLIFRYNKDDNAASDIDLIDYH